MNISFSNIFSLFRKGVTGLYKFGYDIVHGATQFNQYGRDKEKLAVVLSNPAVLKVFALQCNLFSLGKVYVYKGDTELEEDPFLKLLKRPNPFQTESQFLWDYMFWNMLGTVNCYVDSNVVDRKENRMYYMDPSKIEWPVEFEKWKDKLIMSDKTHKTIMETQLKYRYDDGTCLEFPLSKLSISFDLTNGIGNWFKGPSRLDALYKIVSNSEHALDAENINIRYSGKFLVGQDGPTDLSKIGMGEDEKRDIRRKIDTDSEKVWPINAKINIRRFVEDRASLQLDKAYLDAYYLVGNMFDIPRDVLEAYNTSSTFENQEKARAAHVNYCFEPKGNQFMNALEVKFGYDLEGKNILMDWSHLPFYQVFESEKADVKTKTINNFKALVDMGVSPENANQYLDTDFEIEEPDGTEEEIIPAGSETDSAAEDQTDPGTTDNQEEQ